MVQLETFQVPAPGRYGLNTQGDVDTDTLDWAVTADNCTYDEFGRLVSRKGWVQNTTTPLGGTPQIDTIFEYKITNIDTKIISAANNLIYHGTTTLTNITGTPAKTANNWTFQNFNGKVVGWQQGHTPIVWNNTGNFAIIVASDGTLPLGDTCLSAFGRIWAFDAGGTVLQYSGLLNEALWASAGAGSVDLKSNKAAVHSGTDYGVALAEFNGRLIVLLKNTVLIYAGAFDPATMVLQDVIRNVGCAAKDSVKSLGNELVWLSQRGLVGLSRALSSGSMPSVTYSGRVRDAFLSTILAAGNGPIRAAYNESDGFYVICSQPYAWVFDVKQPLEDGTFRVTQWTQIEPRSVHFAVNQTLYIGKAGVVGSYSGDADNTTSFQMKWVSNWSKLATNQFKFVKALEFLLSHTGQQISTISIAYDYLPTVSSAVVISGMPSVVSEWNVSQWNIDEFGVGKGQETARSTMVASGTYLQVSFSAAILNKSLSVQNLKLLLTLGRTSY
ncbi:MAG: hypothetical protein ACREYE_23525 [Gammaproteobacteria bacterium]